MKKFTIAERELNQERVGSLLNLSGIQKDGDLLRGMIEDYDFDVETLHSIRQALLQAASHARTALNTALAETKNVDREEEK